MRKRLTQLTASASLVKIIELVSLESIQRASVLFIPKEKNPRAVASLRPIKDNWAALKKAMYDGGWEAKSFDELSTRLFQILSSIFLLGSGIVFSFTQSGKHEELKMSPS